MTVSPADVQTSSPAEVADPHWELRLALAVLAVVLIVVGLAIRLDESSSVQRSGVNSTPTPNTTISLQGVSGDLGGSLHYRGGNQP